MLLLYQMGRVGSHTIKDALQDRAEPYHVHGLIKTDGEFVTSANLSVFKKLNKAIETGEGIRIISLARDPVARSISAFFWQIHMFCGDKESTLMDVEAVRNCFLYKYNMNFTLDWFDYEFVKVLRFPLYDYPFDWEKGYTIYEFPILSVLIIRTEDLNRSGAAAIKEFMNIDVEIGHSNPTKRRRQVTKYYDNFINNVVFDEEYLDRMYNSNYAKYFYASHELEAFKKRWMGLSRGDGKLAYLESSNLSV